MSQLARQIIACALFATVASAAPAVAPPFDASTQFHTANLGVAIELLKSTDAARVEEALALLERSIAAAPQAGDTDYPVAWVARAAARLCRPDVALAHYKIMRTYFVGPLGAGAGGAHRDWDIHLAITRAHLAKCTGAKAALATMATLDKRAKPMPVDKLFANLPPTPTRPPSPPLDPAVGVIGAWRFDPRKNAWVPQLPVSVTPRITKRVELPDRAAPDGLYAVIWQEPGRLIEGLLDKGKPDCNVRNDANLDELEQNRQRLRCVPGRGLTMVPQFDAASVLAPRDLAVVQDFGESLIQLYERAQPTPQDLQIYFQREGQALVVRGTSDYGRTLALEIDRLSIFDPKSSTWKPLAAPARMDVQTFCTTCAVAAHHRRRASAADSKIWTPVIASSVPALLHLRGKFNGQPLTKLIFNGATKCLDVDIGTRPGMMATCVPDGENSASARFVPLPP